MAKRLIVAESTPLGHRVVLTRDRWREIVRYKHPALAGHEDRQEGTSPVDKVRVYYDRVGNSLSVWFDDPQKESICEEVDDDVVLVKDRRGRVIGFERLNYLSRKQRAQPVHVPIEVQML